MRRKPTTDTASITQLRGLPAGLQPAVELVGHLCDRQPDLLERVAVAQRDRVVLHRLVVDRDAPRRAYLVLAPVALADGAARVEFSGHPLAQLLVDRAGLLGLAV